MIFLAAEGAAPIAGAFNLNRARMFLAVVDAGGENGLAGWCGRILRIHIFFEVLRYLERQWSGVAPAPGEHKVLGRGMEGGLRDVF